MKFVHIQIEVNTENAHMLKKLLIYFGGIQFTITFICQETAGLET